MDKKFINSIKLRQGLSSNSYLAKLPMVKYLQSVESLPFTKPVTFLVGENGTGKSTLLEAIAVAEGYNAEGGTKNFSFTTNKTHSALCDFISIARTAYAKDGFFLRAESFYNAASYIEEIYEGELNAGIPIPYGNKSLHAQSHGESFLSLVENRFGANSLFFLDEPESALSPSKQLSLIAYIDDLVKQNCQFIIATHSPILMAYPNAQIYGLSEKGINEISYKETEHYQVTKQFLDDPERMLWYLLKE